MSHPDRLEDELHADALAAAALALAADSRMNRLQRVASAATAANLKLLEATSRLAPGDVDTGRLLQLLQRMRLDVEEIQRLMDEALRR